MLYREWMNGGGGSRCCCFADLLSSWMEDISVAVERQGERGVCVPTFVIRNNTLYSSILRSGFGNGCAVSKRASRGMIIDYCECVTPLNRTMM